MHILMISDFYHPLLGGVEQHVRTLGAELCRLGHRVTVATLAVDGQPENDVDGEVRVVRMRSSTQRMTRLFSQDRTWAPPMPDPETHTALRRLVAEIEPDVIHGHDWLARSLFPRRSTSPPFVSSLHYYTRSCARKDLLQRGKQCTGPGAAKCLACAVEHYGAAKGSVTAVGFAVGRRLEDRSASAYIAVSRATAVGNGLDPDADGVFVIPNFLPSTLPVRSVGGDELLAALPGEPFLMYVGDFRAIKGFDLLLDAYERSGIVMPLVVVGKRWPETPERLPSGVTMFVEWPNASVRAALERAAFAVVPSMWEEPFGIVAIEALAGGTPVIAADVGGLRDIVDDLDDVGSATATGIRVPRNDTAELVAAIGRLANDPELRERLGRNARTSADRYRAEVVVPDIVDVYERVAR